MEDILNTVILTIQTVKYFEQIGHFTFVLSAKIPHVRKRTTVDTQTSNVIVKSPLHTLVGRADAFNPNKVQGTF